jgi:TonB family protein
VWVLLISQKDVKSPEKKLTWIEVEPLPPQKKSKDDPALQRRKVVQTSPGEKVETPTPDSYLGWQNQIVDRQTVSKNKTTVIGSEQLSQNKADSLDHKKNNKSKNKNSDRKVLSKLGLALQPPPSTNAGDRPAWATPGTRPEDFIEGVTEGERTALNTREFIFYGYFQRIRERLDRAWIPILRHKLIAYYRSGRHLASSTNHTTKVMVVLNEHGEIIRVELVGESGTRDLDEAAVNAFNKAGPFPNPPKGIVDRNREVRIPWDFVLKT